MGDAFLSDVGTDAPLGQILDDLTWLVGHDTRNPPRDLSVDHPLFEDLRRRLPGFETSVHDYGDGCLAFLAVRGVPNILFNVHLDTVPDAPGWSQDPWTLTRGEDRVVGLGACDIKGAAACLLSVAAASDAPMAMVFTTDEEAGTSVAVRGFLDSGAAAPFERVVVGEPTLAKAVTAHRGIFSAQAEFSGVSGHASQGGRGGLRSAVHAAAQWISAALESDWAAADRLNFGRIEGGLKPNMVAADCVVRFGLRYAPGSDPGARADVLRALAGEQLASLDTRFHGPSLPGVGGDAGAFHDAQARQDAMGDWLMGRGVSLAPPVDFWTEASLFSEAGLPTAVLGPGDIAQAHTVDEWVSLDSLAATFAAYMKVVAP